MGERLTISLACSECDSRNYKTTKKPGNKPEPIALNKFCPKCNRHTLHKETK